MSENPISSSAAEKRVLIIGAGVAGLAAALRLLELKPDWHVTIIEQEDHPGGLASSMRNEEFRADLGPHRIYTELPEIEALLPELIGREQMLTVQRKSELLLGGHFYKYPIRAGELLRQLGVFAMARFFFSAASGKIHSLFGKPKTFEDAMVHGFGRAAYEFMVKPYAGKVWKIDPGHLSAEVARVRVSAGNANKLIARLFRRRERKGAQTALNEFTYIRGGVENLVKNLQEKVVKRGAHIELNSRLEGFEGGNGRVLRARISGGKTEAFNEVISTIPLPRLVEMLQPLSTSPTALAAAGELEYIGLILVGVMLHRERFSENSWIYFPEENLVFNRAYEPRNFDPSMAPEGRTLLVFEVTARWDSDLWRASDDEITQRVLVDAKALKLVADADIAGAFAQRIPYTYPLYSVEYQELLEQMFAYLRQFGNLVSTGRQGLFNHNNMDHSMLMGIRAAEYVAQEEAPAARWYEDLTQFATFRIVD